MDFPFQPRTARPTFRHRKATLDCTLATANCRIQCEQGVFVHSALILLEADLSPITDTTVGSMPCHVPNVCGSACPQLKRRLPFSGTYHAAVAALTGAPCAGGSYELVITSPGTSTPVLVMDDVPPAGIFCP